MKSDIEIAREVQMERIDKIVEKLGVDTEKADNYGKYVAKLPLTLIDEEKVRRNNLILVTAMTATRAGIGKTTVSVGLSMALNKIGLKSAVALREPSLGPCFGMKGGAAGGGYAQVVPMEKINLHFTGDFHAVTSAHNTIAALLDNYLYQHEAEGFGLKKIMWRRVLDVNDRSLRDIVIGLGSHTNGVTRQTGFDITAASELMAVLCLADSIDDLEHRVENILLGFTFDDKPFTVKDLGVAPAITVLLKSAIKPNIVQTLEHTPAFVHGGPFANIAHGCNSVVATKMAMSLSDYAVTEAGFGADLGAEKFYDRKCRYAGIAPKLTVLVVTVGGLKIQGGASYDDIATPDVEALKRGFENMDKHICNIRKFGQNIVVAVNRFASDSSEEIDTLMEHCRSVGVKAAVNEAFAKGSDGAVGLARVVAETIKENPSGPLRFAYEDSDDTTTKIEKVAKNIYGAAAVTYSPAARTMLKRIADLGYGHYPVCIAKTPFSFSTDPKVMGRADGFTLNVRDLIINSGSGMIVAVSGDVLRMPGLPKKPRAMEISLVNGRIEGLS